MPGQVSREASAEASVHQVPEMHLEETITETHAKQCLATRKEDLHKALNQHNNYRNSHNSHNNGNNHSYSN